MTCYFNFELYSFFVVDKFNDIRFMVEYSSMVVYMYGFVWQ